MAHSHNIALALLALAFEQACGADAAPAPGPLTLPGDPQVCEPGRAVACAGVEGCAGGQVCTGDGAGWGPCVCTSTQPDGGPKPPDAADCQPAPDSLGGCLRSGDPSSLCAKGCTALYTCGARVDPIPAECLHLGGTVGMFCCAH